MGIGEDGRMIAALQTERLQALELQALEQIRAFARGNEAVDFKAGAGIGVWVHAAYAGAVWLLQPRNSESRERAQ